MSAWLPISDAPRDGTTLLLLYPSGRVDIGRWEHTTRTVNGKVEYDRAGWTAASLVFGLGRAPEPISFAHLPELPVREGES